MCEWRTISGKAAPVELPMQHDWLFELFSVCMENLFFVVWDLGHGVPRGRLLKGAS